MKKISKAAAKKRFRDSEPMIVCKVDTDPNDGEKLSKTAISVWYARGSVYTPGRGETPSSQWKGTIVDTAWEIFLSEYLRQSGGKIPTFYIE
jgi:hypothetical protein